MPTISERVSTPAVINDLLPVPGNYPAIPEAIKKRFPEAKQWEEDTALWWKRTRRALGDLNQQTSTAVGQTQAVAQSIKFVTAAGSAEITIERIARIDGDNLLAGLINTVTARLNTGDIATAISALTAQAGPGGVLASSITSLTARLDSGDIATAITSLTAYAGPGGTSASAITALSARLNSGGDIATAISTLQVDVGPTGTLATRIDALVASAGIHTYFQGTTPTAAEIGDLWYDSSRDDRIFRWNGSDWLDEVSDARVAAVVTQASAALDSVTGSLIGQYVLKVITGNIVTGMVITSSSGAGTPVSSIKFNAADFLIYNGSGTTGVPVFSASSGIVKLANTLVVDQASNKLYVGTGTYGNTNTAFYVDSSGQMSLKDKLTWNGTTLSITGSITVTGGNALVTGGAAADINAGATTITGGKITTGTVTLTQLNFTPVQSTNVLASINASTEGIVISGSRIQINGSTTFASGYDPTGKISTGGAAADVNSGVTTINGGQITTGTITAAKLNVSTLSAITANVGTLTSGTVQFGTGTSEFLVDSSILQYGSSSGFILDADVDFSHTHAKAFFNRGATSEISIYAWSDGFGGENSFLKMGSGNGRLIMSYDNGTGPSGVPGRSSITASLFGALCGTNDRGFEVVNTVLGGNVWTVEYDGKNMWWDGTGTHDVELFRRTAGELETNSQFWCTQLRNPALDGWTVPLFDGALAISFRWTGSQLECRIGLTNIGSIS